MALKPHIDLSTEIEALQRALEEEKSALFELEKRHARYSVETDACRNALKHLRNTLSTSSKSGQPMGTISALEVDPESGRPRRGARREQIALICQKLGRQGDSFRTIDVVNELREIECDMGPGMQSYTYAVLKVLAEEERFIEKVARGKWILTGGRRGGGKD